MASIVSIRKVKNGKFQGEMMDSIDREGRFNALRALNKGDKDFAGSARHAWFPVTLASLKSLGLDEATLKKLEESAEYTRVAVNIEEPTIDGQKLRIQINETTSGTQYQTENYEKAAKQIEITEKVVGNAALPKVGELEKFVGEQGYFLDEEGKFIYSNAVVTVESQVKHTILPGILCAKSQLQGMASALANPVSVGTSVTAPAM